MKRIAALVLSWGLILFALAPLAGASYQVASVDPSSGPAGTEAIVIVSDFFPGLELEVRAGSIHGPTLGTAQADGTTGDAAISITIPVDAPPGPYVLYVCGSCSSEFPMEATTTFEVTPPPPPTTVVPTTPPTAGTLDLGPLVDVVGERCDIPSGATVIDFDAWDYSMGDTRDHDGELSMAFHAAGHPLWFRQYDRHVISSETGPVGDDHFYLPEVVSSGGFITDTPAWDLWTTSPPMVMRLTYGSTPIYAATHWTLYTGTEGMNLVGQPDYFGFNVGFGHFGLGYIDPENLVVELRVRTMPMERPDATILDQGAWDTVSITLGPGPQPVAYCLMATNTIGDTHWKTAYLIDILPLTMGGDPIPNMRVDIDDMFYGSYPPVGPAVSDQIPDHPDPGPGPCCASFGFVGPCDPDRLRTRRAAHRSRRGPGVA